MLKIRYMISGLACALLVTSPLAADETEKTSQKTDKSKQTQEIGAEDSHLTDALAQWLVNGNKAEVELGRLASEKANASEVKEFAQMMVKDHTEYLEKLKKFTQDKATTVAGADRRTFQDDPADRRTIEKEKSAETKPGDHAHEQKVGFRGDKHHTMEQIGKRAGELHLQMTKDLLSKYEGRDFDRAYVGQQIASHTLMLAKLKAMEEHTTGEFSNVVKEGVQATESHLKKIKELSDNLQQQGEDRESDR